MVVLLDKMVLDRALWLGSEIVAKRCIIAKATQLFGACEIKEIEKCTV